MKWKILEIFKLVQRGNMRQIKSYLFKRQQELPWWLSGRENPPAGAGDRGDP